MKEHDPEMFEFFRQERDVERKIHSLVERVMKGTKEEREKSKDELKGLVAEQFKIRQSRRKFELTRFEEQLKRLRESHEKREQQGDEIIRRRVSELLGERDDLNF
jgi:hypothetical protein